MSEPTTNAGRRHAAWWATHGDPALNAKYEILAIEAEARADALREVRRADEVLGCMWSHDEEHRRNLGHTCSVQASDILRAVLAAGEAS